MSEQSKKKKNNNNKKKTFAICTAAHSSEAHESFFHLVLTLKYDYNLKVIICTVLVSTSHNCRQHKRILNVQQTDTLVSKGRRSAMRGSEVEGVGGPQVDPIST